MRRLFTQFYLLLIAAFLVVVILIGGIYQRVVQNAGDRYLVDLMTSALSQISTELKDVPPEKWQQALAANDRNLSFRLRIESLSHFDLSPNDRRELRRGNIVMLEKDYLFLQSMPDARYVLVAGPLRYLMFLDELQWLDYLLMVLIGLVLSLVVLVRLYPLWKDLSALERASRLFSANRLDIQVELRKRSSIRPLGEAFNHMLQRIQQLLHSKKALTDAVAHELRTPLSRVRYRLAMLQGHDDPTILNTCSAIERDLSEVEAMIDEMLIHARLNSPQTPLQKEWLNVANWMEERLLKARVLTPGLRWHWLRMGETPEQLQADNRLLARAVDNLLANASRYARQQIMISVVMLDGHYRLAVEDDGEGIAEADRERVFDPFVRLDDSRDRKTGGHGLGLAIVAGVATAHGGQARVETSALGGARFVIEWPAQPRADAP